MLFGGEKICPLSSAGCLSLPLGRGMIDANDGGGEKPSTGG
ncbi:hypothetical protein HMPREF0262_02597 [Clostridium sp. ATCC 29733]|nr:hypothetical protein HMPREF0262_02597 [Clostridium sp. ATCC 29733]